MANFLAMVLLAACVLVGENEEPVDAIEFAPVHRIDFSANGKYDNRAL